MASSDDEDILPLSVTNYYFLNARNEPISFSVLPILLDDLDKPDASRKQVYLHGTGDSGLQKVYKQITAWKLGLEHEQPEMMVLTKDGNWIKLLKPRKSYEDTIMRILFSAQLLHFLKRKPESSAKSLWDHLRKTFRSFEGRPAVSNLLGHYRLIELFMKRDNVLAKCQLLLMILKEQPRKPNSVEDLQNYSLSKTSFIIDDNIEEDNADDDEEQDLVDSICSICDDGGRLIGCDGDCMRAFHPTRKDGEDLGCKSLGFTEAQFKALQKFLCKNCRYKQHQCFACGKLGSSDKSAGAEVFRCVSATCGHFYHPKCVAYLLFRENEVEAAKWQKKIAVGEPFTCPVHKCYVCKQEENRDIKELQFAVCRRCPKSYHRKCMPRNISFMNTEEGILQRAWELSNGIVIYCLKHKVDIYHRIPGNHIVFPEISERGRVVQVQNSKTKFLVKNRQVSDVLPQSRTSIQSVKVAEKLTNSYECHPVVNSVRSISKQVHNIQKQLKPAKVHVGSELLRSIVSVQANTKRPSEEKVVQVDNIRPSKEKINSTIPMTSSPSSRAGGVSSYPEIDAETENSAEWLLQWKTCHHHLRWMM